MKSSAKNSLLCALVILSTQTLAHAVDSASLEFATGNKTKMVRGGAQWNWDQQWFKSNGTNLSGYWDATLADWQENNYQGHGVKQSLIDAGITPVFRLQNDSKKGLYGEAGIGLHMLSEIYDNNGRTFSTNFQFGDHIGVGYVLTNGWDIAFKIQHYSNGGVKHPNPGVNFAVVKAGYAF
ncbi:acyloxyacyl hydrolase [Undibacterium sp. RTI2.1]|uniref:acyloxyacyl hydrolase n=1 Tax=unclassified Undibacterium TaxID=2630295 RepID=UPI002AB55949|nr:MULTISPECIES: acyloxyacyl hydrolase [unclassified Undibacterium]MDY7540267.1 acyloxyacyl hydrolase [Undibacterium sp. 5I1]MEB0031129.1 acyloxyacyl hydrolase [Undibacterium sp. RTI2.1]MEB0115280.1 acyloxyacyl hydrolase [Undibacterium sp. RTI2.2]MEB0232562.1 acyloxyacyl hydrolase [Undibacterium sp. 10I3]MEB0259400.1 acyloxyacyl hydrolase [Undibacterium sp. 5I1]